MAKRKIISRVDKYRIVQYEGIENTQYYTVEKKTFLGWRQVSKFYLKVNDCIDLIHKLGGIMINK